MIALTIKQHPGNSYEQNGDGGVVIANGRVYAADGGGGLVFFK